MKPRLRIAIADYSRRGFRPRDNFITRSLAQRYELEFSDNPHVVFYSWRGQSHRRFRCLRVFFTGENLRPDWRQCDYAIGFDRTENSTYLRLPNFAQGAYGNLSRLVKGNVHVGKLLAEKTKFCNFICSNPLCHERIRFFDKLSRYRRVDSPGKVRNNMPDALAPRYGPVKWFEAKVEFIRRYKFTIAFENSSHPGYTTEKLPQPMWADSLPIYWGDPLVHIDFNPRSFLNYFDYGSHDALIERIIELDRNDDLYAQYMREPWYHDNRLPDAFKPSRLDEFLCKVVETPRQPVARQSWLTRFLPLWVWPTAKGSPRAAA